MRHHFRAQRRRPALDHVDLRRDLLLCEHALLDQQQPHRLFEHLVRAHLIRVVIPARRVRIAMIVSVIIVIVVVIIAGVRECGRRAAGTPDAERDNAVESSQ
mgnify:CR=1 FL=1